MSYLYLITKTGGLRMKRKRIPKRWWVKSVVALLVIFITLPILLTSAQGATVTHESEPAEENAIKILGSEEDLVPLPGPGGLPFADVRDATILMKAVIGMIELTPEELEEYGLIDPPNVRDIVKLMQYMLDIRELTPEEEERINILIKLSYLRDPSEVWQPVIGE